MAAPFQNPGHGKGSWVGCPGHHLCSERGCAGGQAQLGYVSYMFGDVIFSWSNVMTEFHRYIDKVTKKPAAPESPQPQSPSSGISQPPQANEGDGGEGGSEEPLQTEGVVNSTVKKKHHRTLAGKGGKRVISNVKMLPTDEWKPFLAGVAAN